MFDLIQHRLEAVARGAAICGGIALCGAAFMVTADVLSRKILGVTMRGSDEITGYIFAASTSWAYAYALLTRSNIRIDVVYLRLGPRSRAILDLVGLALLTLYIFLLTRGALSVVRESLLFDYSAQTPLATPLWIPQSFWFVGLAFMLICLAFLIVRAVWHMIQRDWTAVGAVAGVKSLDQEIKEETHV